MIKSTLLPVLSLTFFILTSITHSGCTQPNPGNTVVIAGEIRLHPEWASRLYLLKPASFTKILAPYEMPVTDTIPLSADGSFALEKEISAGEAGLYVLVSQPASGRFPNALESLPFRENYIFVHLAPGGRIRLSADIDRMSHSVTFLDADSTTRELNALHVFRTPLVDEIETRWKNAPDPGQFQWNIHGSEEISQAIHQDLDAYLDTATSFYPVMAALRFRAPDHNYRDRPEFFIRVYQKLSGRYPDHPWVKELAYHLRPENLPVLEGEPMPDFHLPTADGEPLQLKDIQAKLILVDFWASWCAPCRKEIRTTLLPLYARYHSAGFEILGISIDSDKHSWINAIQKDGATWPQVSDLQGDASPVRQSLKFDTIPACYLLDEHGRLLARNLHGEALEDFVQAYFQ